MYKGYCVHFELALYAYIIDRLFGEFSFIPFYKHPVIFMGNFCTWFEKHFYKDAFFRGMLLNLSLLVLISLGVYGIEYYVENLFLLALIASTGLASRSLYESVKAILQTPEAICYLVSRDTEHLSQSEIHKAAIETYAENLSDGVIAPLFYLLLFGLYGLFLYKGINTLDSMVGYKNQRYTHFGKFSALLDDVANFIPARITAVFIALLFGSRKALRHFYRYGKGHASPNAGHPISAIALCLGICLGGPTSYFGKIEPKPFFGEGRVELEALDLQKALALQPKLDASLLIFLMLGALCTRFI
jgi:adenosylcobinamide-phosphate synthase